MYYFFQSLLNYLFFPMSLKNKKQYDLHLRTKKKCLIFLFFDGENFVDKNFNYFGSYKLLVFQKCTNINIPTVEVR